MDLGVGVYRDSRGDTPVFGAVKVAEKYLVESQSTKTYLGSEGDPAFVALLAAQAFQWTGAAGVQTIGGTGALRLAADLLACTKPGRRIWIGLPTWPNHLPIFAASGLRAATVDLLEATTGRYRPDKLLEVLRDAAPGDAVLLHGCCHNPTGVDLRRLAEGQGMFAMLPLSVAEIDLLQSEFGIYMPHSGRINIAGLAEDLVARFVDALRAAQCKSAA